ncbi:MAG: sodium/proton-translocating pyrophosphatase, partial [Brachybacterium sp.]|nr:sodium/proton-translocating pyrophosphatase [Brachybacterium sp.]
GTSLLAFAAGAVTSALALRVVSATADIATAGAALLVGADENDLGREAADNPGAVHAQRAELLRRAPVRAADLMAIAAAVLGVGVALGVPVLMVEGLLVPLVALGAAMLAALVSTLVPQLGTAGRESATLTLGGAIPGLLGAGGLIAAIGLWLPRAYGSLRFDAVGLGNFTDPAITGGQPIPRDQLEEQLIQAGEHLGELLQAPAQQGGIGSGPEADTMVDVIALYSIHPNTVAAIALGTGALLAFATHHLAGVITGHRSGPTLLVGRTSRTGGAIGALTGTGVGGFAAAGLVLLVVIALGALMVVGEGISLLTLLLLAYAAAGMLVVSAGHAALHTAGLLGDREDAERSLREAARDGETSTSVVLQIASALVGLAAVGAVVAALNSAITTPGGRGASLWQDRALYALTPSSLAVLGGTALGAMTVLLVAAAVLEAGRRVAADAVVESRAALLQHGSGALHLDDLAPSTRTAALLPLALAVLMPLIAGFGVGGAALPAFTVAVVLTALLLGLWSTFSAATGAAALEVIESGRYGGRSSWAHSAALGNAVIGTGMRGALGATAVPAAMLSALVAALVVPSVVDMSTGGTSVWLRLLVAVGALILLIAAWSALAGTSQPDLDDHVEEADQPLFGRRDREADDDSAGDPLLTSWDAEDEEGARRPRGSRRSARGAAAKKPRDRRRTGE